jgi:hypothetical protein
MKHKENKVIILNGMAWIRVYSACQALMAPTKFYRATHKACKQVLQDELGFCPKGKPGTACMDGSPYNKGFRQGGNEAILDWLGVVHKETHKEEGCVLPTDQTLLVCKDFS